MARKCVFCDSPGVTREHVWPEWALASSTLTDAPEIPAFVFTVSAMYFVFQVLGVRDARYTPATRPPPDDPWTPLTLRIWPPTGQSVTWPPSGVGFDEEGLRRFASRDARC